LQFTGKSSTSAQVWKRCRFSLYKAFESNRSNQMQQSALHAELPVNVSCQNIAVHFSY